MTKTFLTTYSPHAGYKGAYEVLEAFVNSKNELFSYRPSRRYITSRTKAIGWDVVVCVGGRLVGSSAFHRDQERALDLAAAKGFYYGWCKGVFV